MTSLSLTSFRARAAPAQLVLVAHIFKKKSTLVRILKIIQAVWRRVHLPMDPERDRFITVRASFSIEFIKKTNVPVGKLANTHAAYL